MSYNEASRAGRVASALLSILAFSPMVSSARRAAMMSSTDVTEESIEGHVTVLPAHQWDGRLLVSVDYKRTGTWRTVEPLEPGTLMLSNGGLYAYKGDGENVKACVRPKFGFSRMNFDEGATNHPVTICNASVYIDLYTARVLDEEPTPLPGEGALLQLQDLDLARYHPSLADYGFARCFGLQGCSDKACSGGLRSVKVCSPDTTILRKAEHATDAAMMERTQLKKLFPSEIAHAVNHANLHVLDPASRHNTHMPTGFFSFSPYNVPGNEVPAQEMLAKLSASFSQGIIAHEPGKNSRSGAIFFFSKDKNYMAKRIRRPEMIDLWKLARDRSFFERAEAGSVLSPIYLAFTSARTTPEVDAEEDNNWDNWVVMRTERLGPEIDELLEEFERVKEFFYDLKPAPMESDRKKALGEFNAEYLRDGFRGYDLPDWKDILRNVSHEVEYLKSHSIVDYSAFMYGAHFDVYNSTIDYAEKIERIKALVSGRTGCTAGCRESREFGHSKVTKRLPASPRADREFIDITSRMDRGRFRQTTDGKTETYNCCCVAIPTGRSDSVYAPCVLVNTKTKRRNRYWPINDCANKLVKGWYDYTKTELLPGIKGKCIVDYEGQPWSPTNREPGRLKDLAAQGDILKPGPAFNLRTPQPLMAKCAIMCVSLADYLLRYDFLKQVENLVLLPWYGSLKWTEYDTKFKALVDCFSSPGLPDCGTFTAQEQHDIDAHVIDRLVDHVLPVLGHAELVHDPLAWDELWW